MEKSGRERLQFSKIQIGVIVGDLDKAVEYYEALGIGPFRPSKGTPTDRKVYGKPDPDIKNRAKVAQIGPIEFELLQPISGKSVQRKFLETKGEGISHLGFHVDDLDKEVAKLIRKGFQVISSGRYVEESSGGFAWFDIDKIGGIQFELMKQPK